VPRKSRYQDDDITFEHVLARVEPWLRERVKDPEIPLVRLATDHPATGSCPAKCRICGICHVVVHCGLAQQHEAAYALAEHLTDTRDKLDELRVQLEGANGKYRRTLLRARRRMLPAVDTVDETILPGEAESQKAARLLGAVVENLHLAKEEILGRTITPNLADPAAARRPAYLRTVVEAYLGEEDWKAAEVFELLEGRAPTHLELKRMYARASEAKVRGDLQLLRLRKEPTAGAAK